MSMITCCAFLLKIWLSRVIVIIVIHQKVIILIRLFFKSQKEIGVYYKYVIITPQEKKTLKVIMDFDRYQFRGRMSDDSSKIVDGVKGKIIKDYGKN